MLDIEKSTKQFSELPREVILTIDNERVAQKLDEIGKKHDLDLYALLIFICVGEIGDEGMEEYLRESQGASDLASKKCVSELREKVLKPLERRLNFLNPAINKPMGLEEQKKFAFEVFSERLMVELGNDNIIKETFNQRIFYILSRDLSFKNEIERALYKNDEVVSDKKFLIDGQAKRPDVKHWLKYFIKLRGTSIFDNMALTSFITESENAKRLDAEEKKKLHKILVLYRNIKFFPESMPSDDGEGWEIVPLEAEEKPLRKTIKKQTKSIESNDLISNLGGGVEDYAPGSLEREILEEEDEENQEYQKLLLLVNKYPEGSLERRAVEEELKKFDRD